jgi:hypothetical protein
VVYAPPSEEGLSHGNLANSQDDSCRNKSIDLPPIGSLGLPVINCKKARRVDASYSERISTRSRIARLSTLNPWSAFRASMRAVV